MIAATPATAYCEAHPPTLHWTVSLYVDAGRLFADAANGRREHDGETRPPPIFGTAFDASVFRALQLRDPVSRALRDSVEPLFNDIADREWLGDMQDFVLAADTIEAGCSRKDASAWSRATFDVRIRPPGQVEWMTEGKRFVAAPQGLDAERRARLRRFWFVHNNGALSYHLSFEIGYRHDLADFYFLSLLQKLTAPKEFTLPDAMLAGTGAARASPLDTEPLQIDALDRLAFAYDGESSLPFWHFVRERFGADAASLFDRIAATTGMTADVPIKAENALKTLVDQVAIPEVPGLLLPKCRTLIFFHDPRFFRRLIPAPGKGGTPAPERRAMVRDECYAPYAKRLKQAISDADGATVVLGDDGEDSFWHWVRGRRDEPFYRQLTDSQIDALRDGSFEMPDGARLHIPAFEPGRTDCLDYLFLSGFNQNIIDFMNQDTSEILDSLDPIYPATDRQNAEGFFVRYANHRAMITYAPSSRSLEVGNDTIGTCPYAFLIHVLSMHNEFLARAHERESFTEVDRLYRQMRPDGGEPIDYPAIEAGINAIKIDSFHRYDRHRHINIFRYDTEHDVFEKLEKLRGVERKQQSLDRAIASLEDLARDLETRQHRQQVRTEGERALDLSAILFALGLFGIVQLLFLLADYAQRHPAFLPALPIATGPRIAMALGAIGIIVSIATAILTIGVALPRLRSIYHLLRKARRDRH